MDQIASSTSPKLGFADLATEIRMAIWELVYADIHIHGRVLHIRVHDDGDARNGDRWGHLTFAPTTSLSCTTKPLRDLASVNFEVYSLMRKWLPDTLPLNKEGCAVGELWFQDGQDILTLVGIPNCASLYCVDHQLVDPLPRSLPAIRSLLGPPHTPSLQYIGIDIKNMWPSPLPLIARIHRTLLLTQLRFPQSGVYVVWKVEDEGSNVVSRARMNRLLGGLGASSLVATNEVNEVCRADETRVREIFHDSENVDDLVQLANAVRTFQYGLAFYEVDAAGQARAEEICPLRMGQCT